jgi:hypothetical protein
MLITPAYVEEQKLLHRQDAYGSRGFNWGYLIAGIARIENCNTVLDYGCGKGTLVRTLTDAKIAAHGYDPAVPQFSAMPVPADLVACVDVLEHIEPECLDDVLDHFARLTKKILFVAISMTPAKRKLSDGRNTHIIIERPEWWRPMFEKREFSVRRVWNTGLDEWVAMMQAKA